MYYTQSHTHGTPHTVHCTLYTVHCTMHTAHCTIPSDMNWLTGGRSNNEWLTGMMCFAVIQHFHPDYFRTALHVTLTLLSICGKHTVQHWNLPQNLCICFTPFIFWQFMVTMTHSLQLAGGFHTKHL